MPLRNSALPLFASGSPSFGRDPREIHVLSQPEVFGLEAGAASERQDRLEEVADGLGIGPLLELELEGLRP